MRLQRIIKLKTIFRIVRQKEYDRYLFIHEIGGHITGLNFHFYTGDEPMMEYKEPNKLLTEIYMNLEAILDETRRINTALEIYFIKTDFFNRINPVETEPVDGRVIQIPKSQIELVRNAINFYLQSIQSLEKEYADTYHMSYCDMTYYQKRMHDIFDLEILQELFNYPTSVQLTEEQCKSFGSRHGYDLPDYIY